MKNFNGIGVRTHFSLQKNKMATETVGEWIRSPIIRVNDDGYEETVGTYHHYSTDPEEIRRAYADDPFEVAIDLAEDFRNIFNLHAISNTEILDLLMHLNLKFRFIGFGETLVENYNESRLRVDQMIALEEDMNKVRQDAIEAYGRTLQDKQKGGRMSYAGIIVAGVQRRRESERQKYMRISS